MSDTLPETLPKERPTPTQADADYWAKVLTPVGPERKGSVLEYGPAIGNGYVRESGTGALFAFVMRFIGPPVLVTIGTVVYFRDNGNNQIVQLRV